MKSNERMSFLISPAKSHLADQEKRTAHRVEERHIGAAWKQTLIVAFGALGLVFMLFSLAGSPQAGFIAGLLAACGVCLPAIFDHLWS